MISEPMQRKIAMITGKEKELLEPSPSLNPEDSGGFAFICSFSIEIIFIVAFFLLLMFVIILNFVFWWITVLPHLPAGAQEAAGRHVRDREG